MSENSSSRTRQSLDGRGVIVQRLATSATTEYHAFLIERLLLAGDFNGAVFQDY